MVFREGLRHRNREMIDISCFKLIMLEESLRVWQYFFQSLLTMLLMEEILHLLIGSWSHHLQGFIHPRWCRISSINSILQSLATAWTLQFSWIQCCVTCLTRDCLKNGWEWLWENMSSFFQLSIWEVIKDVNMSSSCFPEWFFCRFTPWGWKSWMNQWLD